MSFDSLLIHEVTLWQPVPDVGNPDNELYGDDHVTYEETETVRARIEHGAKGGNEDAAEMIAAKELRLTDYRVFLRPETNITALTKLEFEGRMLRVNGKPAMIWDGVGEHHWEANLMEVEGG